MNLLYQKMGTDGETYYKEIPVDTDRIESMKPDKLLYQQKMGSDGKTYYEPIPIEKLTDKLRGGAGELGFKYFYQKNKEYVKKWKEVLVNRQLFEMWHALTPKEQKVWIDKATRFDKLFAMTNNLVLKYSEYRAVKHHEMLRRYPKKEISNFEYKSSYEYYMYVAKNFGSFFQQQLQLKPTVNWREGGRGSRPDPKMYDSAFREEVFQLWKESSIYPMFKPGISWEQLGEEGRQEWQDALDALEHAYDMFCEKTKITKPEMRLTDEDVKDHLSRMWEALDTETQNTWIYSADDTLPVRDRKIRGLFEDSDSDEE